MPKPLSLATFLPVLLFATNVANAEPVLLASKFGGAGASLLVHCSPACPGATGTDGVLIAMTYGFADFSGGTGPYGLDVAFALTPDRLLQSGETNVVFDLDASNNADFHMFAAILTSGQPINLTDVTLLPLQNPSPGLPVYAASGTGPLPDHEALAGAQLDFVRLIVEDVFAKVDNTDGAFYAVNAHLKWEFWGRPAAPTPVPEPSSVSLILSALLGGVIARRRIG